MSFKHQDPDNDIHHNLNKDPDAHNQPEELSQTQVALSLVLGQLLGGLSSQRAGHVQDIQHEEASDNVSGSGGDKSSSVFEVVPDADDVVQDGDDGHDHVKKSALVDDGVSRKLGSGAAASGVSDHAVGRRTLVESGLRSVRRLVGVETTLGLRVERLGLSALLVHYVSCRV